MHHHAPPHRPVRQAALRALEPLQRQIACRAINEHIREISKSFAAGNHVEFVCECARPGCLELVPLSPRLYEEVRSLGNRFFAKEGHADEEGEMSTREGSVIIEKTGDEAAEAIRADPRHNRVSPEAA